MWTATDRARLLCEAYSGEALLPGLVANVNHEGTPADVIKNTFTRLSDGDVSIVPYFELIRRSFNAEDDYDAGLIRELNELLGEYNINLQ
jgi:hypothetical protein